MRKHNPVCKCRSCIPAHGYLGATSTDPIPWDFNLDKAWVETSTLEGDNLSSLSRAYGVSSKEITDANNVPFSSSAINQWVLSVNGKYQSGNSGETAFTKNSKIMLPNKPRGTVSPTTSKPVVVSPDGVPSMMPGESKSSYIMWGAAAVGTTVLVALATRAYKKK